MNNAANASIGRRILFQPMKDSPPCGRQDDSCRSLRASRWQFYTISILMMSTGKVTPSEEYKS
jgi:hypothetical protein